jgi:RecA-family ATPase
MQEMLFDGFPLPAYGATLMVGAPKSGKTLLAAQTALALARKKHLFDNYTLLQPGAVMIVEQDDPAGAASIRDIAKASGGGPDDMPFYVVPKLEFGFGPAMLDWLESEITKRKLRLVVLDSYTALRGPRGPGIDIVKVEQAELGQLDALAKRLQCAMVIIHHASKAAAGLDWTQNAAGSFIMTGATEALIHVSRFADLDSGPERLVRIRSRHGEDLQLVLRFRKDTLDYEHVHESAAAPLYPVMKQIHAEFGADKFGIKELSHATGVSRVTAFRQIDRLRQADVIRRLSYGEYVLTEKH